MAYFVIDFESIMAIDYFVIEGKRTTVAEIIGAEAVDAMRFVFKPEGFEWADV